MAVFYPNNASHVFAGGQIDKSNNARIIVLSSVSGLTATSPVADFVSLELTPPGAGSRLAFAPTTEVIENNANNPVIEYSALTISFTPNANQTYAGLAIGPFGSSFGAAIQSVYFWSDTGGTFVNGTGVTFALKLTSRGG
jgi:hypothetical protein